MKNHPLKTITVPIMIETLLDDWDVKQVRALGHTEDFFAEIMIPWGCPECGLSFEDSEVVAYETRTIRGESRMVPFWGDGECGCFEGKYPTYNSLFLLWHENRHQWGPRKEGPHGQLMLF